jgi:Uma2 family endonuclease
MPLPPDLVSAQTERPYFEWANGKRREKVSPTLDRARIQMRLGAMLDPWGRKRGVVASEVDTNVTPSPGDTRRYLPDVGFTSFTSLRAAGQLHTQIPEIAPDLAIEILSPRQDRTHLAEKVAAYLAAGSTVVIIVDPATCSIAVHRHDGVRTMFTGETFADPAFPGLSIDLTELFSAIEWPSD